MDDLISRQTLMKEFSDFVRASNNSDFVRTPTWNNAVSLVESIPPAQPDGIPLEWIDKHLEWLDNCDNDFAQLAKVSIKAMVELWKKDRI